MLAGEICVVTENSPISGAWYLLSQRWPCYMGRVSIVQVCPFSDEISVKRNSTAFSLLIYR